MTKSKKLLEIIKKAVREEIRTVIKEELAAVLGENKLKIEHIDHGLNLTELAKTSKNPYEQGITAKKKRKNVEFTKDPVLNKILNETADEEWKTMGNKTFTDGRSGMASMMGMQSPDQAFGGKPTIEQMLPNDRKHVQVSDEMADILTKDYSALLKKVDEKANKARP
tara:strand:+ start:55 stop:555 length:501 start_codon:yes stop_codon:yes gene_type:complete